MIPPSLKVDARNLGRLLWPHFRPFRWVFVGVLMLGFVTSVAQQSAVLLIKPVWEVLFPAESNSQAQAGADGATDGATDGDTTEEDTTEEGTNEEGTNEVPTPSWVVELKRDFSRLILGQEGVPGGLAERRGLLIRVALIIAIVAFLAAGSNYAFSVLGTWIAYKVVVSMRRDLAAHLIGLSLRYHGGRKLGDLISRASADVTKASTVVHMALRDLIRQPLRGMIALAGAAILAPQVTLLVLIGLPILVLPIAKILNRVRKKSGDSLKDLGASVQALTQMFQGIRTVKAFRAEERELARYETTNERFRLTAMKMARASALSQAWTLLYTHIGLAVVLLALGWLALGNPNQQSSDLAPFFILISEAYSAVKGTTRAWGQVAESSGACDRLQEMLEEKPDITESPDAVDCDGIGSGIRLEGVEFAYPDAERSAIKSVDLHVRPGETLALVGPSGAGKSTLLDLMARFLDPTGGRITVNGIDLRELRMDSWSSRFAMVTQVPFLFHDTIGENIRYGKPDATNEEVLAAAAAANIKNLIEGLPEGLDTDALEAGSRLSGGECQRITIARAILHGGELLLLDEATSALDTESEAVVQEALDELMSDKTVVVIAHRLSTIRNADRIAVLDGGQIVELGTHAELLERKGLYARLHAMQFRDTESHT